MSFRYLFVSFFILITGCISQSPNGRYPAAETVTGGDSTAQGSSPCGEGVEVCAIINRNPADQSMVVYDSNGNVKYKFPVSTGRETFDIPTNFNINPDGCSDTPRGTFSPTTLRENHYSNTWLVKNPETGKYEDGALMKHSIFFNGGVAIHAAGTVSASAALGPKSPGNVGTGSGGCVRLYPWDAQTLFDEIAGCEATSEEKKVCTIRDISNLENRPSSAKINKGQCPDCSRCLKTEKIARCVDYNAPNPNCNAEERASRPGHCEDPKQFTVAKKQKTVKIIVKDNRSEAEIAAVRAKCKEQENIFNQSKAECLAGKLQLSSPAELQKSLAALSRSKQNQLSYQCNEQLYYKAEAERAQNGGLATTPPSNNSAEQPPLNAPKPERKKFRDTKLGSWVGKLFSGHNPKAESDTSGSNNDR